MSTTTMNKGPEAIRICTAMTILCTIFVALRLWARRFKRMALAADDYMILVSLALVYGALAIIIISVQNGLGQSVVVVETTITNGLSNVLKGLMAVEIVYGTSLVTIKIGVLLMYYQIFPTRPFRISALVIGVVIMMWWIAILFVSIFQCTPVAYAWDKTIVGGKCINSNNFYIGNAVPNIITDLAILALPAREVWNLQMPRSQKAAIMGMFMMGGLVVIISIIRLASLFDLSAQGANADITYVLTLPWIYTTIEPTIGIISACLPTLRPLAYSCWGRTPQPSQKTPINSNLVTIGGSGGGIPTWSMGGKVKGDDGTGSFERLNESSEGGNGSDHGSGEAGFTPKGYSSHRQNRISVRAENDEVGSLDEYPMHSIRVKKEVDWKEQKKM